MSFNTNAQIYINRNFVKNTNRQSEEVRLAHDMHDIKVLNNFGHRSFVPK